MTIDGIGRLADDLRASSMTAECATTIVVAEISAEPIRFTDLTDDDFDAAWEQPMRHAIVSFQAAHRAGHQRIIAIVPTIAMSGAPRLAHVAATAEAIRLLVKSAARQWGADGITVNCIAVSPSLFGISPEAVGAVSLAPPALASAGSLANDIIPLIALLAGAGAHHLTGSTLTADGGVWMAP